MLSEPDGTLLTIKIAIFLSLVQVPAGLDDLLRPSEQSLIHLDTQQSLVPCRSLQEQRTTRDEYPASNRPFNKPVSQKSYVMVVDGGKETKIDSS